jgi:hypothetical protein
VIAITAVMVFLKAISRLADQLVPSGRLRRHEAGQLSNGEKLERDQVSERGPCAGRKDWRPSAGPPRGFPAPRANGGYRPRLNRNNTRIVALLKTEAPSSLTRLGSPKIASTSGFWAERHGVSGWGVVPPCRPVTVSKHL